MHDSLAPLGGLVPLVNMMLGEVIFGGVGAGLYGMLMFVLLTVFIAGLMVGRTPEYLGKKIEARGDQVGRDRRPRARGCHPHRQRGDDAVSGGAQQPEQRRAAWLERNSLRLHFRGGEQRQRLRRP